MLDEITPLVLTYNEAPNIGRTLAGLSWAARIVVVDSFSTDETVAICQRHPKVEVVHRKFDNHTDQWNFGLAQIKTRWVLTLDADYILAEAFVKELRDWLPTAGTNAYFASFRYCIFGRPLRASLYPARAVIFDPKQCRYAQDGHTQRLEIRGPTGRFRQRIDHDDRKPLSDWLRAQDRYATLEAKKMLVPSAAGLPAQDRIRRMILPAPFLVLGYTLFAKGLIFEGWPGWFYVFQRTLAEVLLSLRLLEARLKTYK